MFGLFGLAIKYSITAGAAVVNKIKKLEKVGSGAVIQSHNIII